VNGDNNDKNDQKSPESHITQHEPSDRFHFLGFRSFHSAQDITDGNSKHQNQEKRIQREVTDNDPGKSQLNSVINQVSGAPFLSCICHGKLLYAAV
jgi:hypothetical protein